MGLNDGRRDGASTSTAAPTARAPKGTPGGNGSSNMSLTAVRKKESKRVRTKESATVSMLTKLLDDDGTAGSRKQKQAKRRRMSQQQQQSASKGGRSANINDPGGSRAAGIPSFRSANSGSKTNQNASNKHGKHTSVPGRSTGIGNNTGRPTSSASAGAWSDIVSNASTGSLLNSSGNPFASTSCVGIQAQNMKSKTQASAAAAAERAKSLSLARKRAAVMAKNSSKRRQQQAKNQLSQPSNTANCALGTSAIAVASTSKGASGERPRQLQSSTKKTRPKATTDLSMATSISSERTPKFGPTDTSTGVASAKPNRSNMDAPTNVGIVNLGLQPTSLMSKKKRPTRPAMMSGNVTSSAVSFALESNFDDASSNTLTTGESSTVDVDDIVGPLSTSIAAGPGGIGSSSVGDERSASHFTSYAENNGAINIAAAAAPYVSTDILATESNPAKRTFDHRSYKSTSYQSAATNDTAGVTTKRRKATNNDNFVKLNLRNSAGSCRGARNKKGKRGGSRYGGRGSNGRGGSSYNSQKPYSVGNGSDDENDSDNDWKSRRREKSGVRLVQNSSAGIDPLDDYLDGTYKVGQKKQNSDGKSSSASKESAESTSSANAKMTADEEQASKTKARADQIPRCTRHQRPCKLLTVKKSNTGNKGRKFYVCGLPKGEQCDFFQWEDDTVHSIQKALLQSSSTSGFVARQVAAYVDRFKALTLPELRDEAKRLGLRHIGKKGQLLARLTIHVRDEVAKSVVADDEKGSDEGIIDLVPLVDQDSKTFPEANDDETCSSSSEDSSTSSSSEEDDELELVGDGPIHDDAFNQESPSDEECGDADDKKDDGNDGEEDESDSDPIYKALHNFFGYRDFRPGQEWAIRRVLQQERSLLVAPTGLGKSMCYALPATQVEGVCLVVSPLISLMQDQLRHLPPNIPAATLSGNLSSLQVAMTIDDLMKNRIKILFVSPERLASPAFRRLIRPKFNTETRQYERQFPTVSLLCLDEAHCLSQWGHNFRPSYLRIRSLVPMLEPKSILALTATAGPMVIKDICHTLGIPMSSRGGIDNDGVRVLDCKRDNIDVATLVMDSEDSRRSLVRTCTNKSGCLPFFLFQDISHPFFDTIHFSINFNSCTRFSRTRNRRKRVMIALTSNSQTLCPPIVPFSPAA